MAAAATWRGGRWRGLCLSSQATLVVLLAFPLPAAEALVNGIPAPGSNVPVAETARCPEGYYRKAVLVFACGQQDGEVYFPLANVSKTAVGIPKGIRNLKLTLDASGPVNITLIDPATNTLVSDGTKPVEWNGVTVAFTSGPSRGGTKEGVDMSGTLESNLRVNLANNLSSQEVAAITYSYDGFEDCPQVPVGCARYDQKATREWVYNWSTWVSTKYPKAAQAWQAVASQAMHAQYGSSARAGPIPFHLWHGVWLKWPGATSATAKAKNLDWQAAFKFIDSLRTEDQLVEVVEFIRAYKLAGIGLSMYNWCTALRTQYPDAATAWLAVAGPTSIAGIDYSRWKSAVWPSFTPPDNFAKASSAGAFQYADASNNGVVSKAEFESIYDSCNYRPLSYETTSTSTTVSPMPSTTVNSTTVTSTVALEVHHAAATKPNASSSKNATADLAANRTGGNASAASRENDTAAPAAAATDVRPRANATAAAGNATRERKCCREAVATCMACDANQSVSDFCESIMGIGVQGCPDAVLADVHEDRRMPDVRPDEISEIPLWREATTPAPQAKVSDDDDSREEVSDCPFKGISYAPRLENHNETIENSSSDCQARCAETAGCAFFTFRSVSDMATDSSEGGAGGGPCNLHGPTAVWSLATEPEAVAGPSVCSARIGIRISDVDFPTLTDSQKRSILRRIVADIGNVTGLPRESVKDLSGRPSSVSLSAGSLVAGARLELPPSVSLANASARLRDEALVQRLRTSLAEAGIRSPEVAGHAVHHRHAVDVEVEASHSCLLVGTRYDAPANAPVGGDARLSLAQSGTAANTSACQTRCLEEEGCEYFTFVPSTEVCLLRGGSAVVAIRDPEAVAGPRQCAGLPVVPRGFLDGAGEGEEGELGSGGQAGGGDSHVVLWWLFGVTLVCCVLGGVALALLPKRKRKRGGKSSEYAPLSREDHEDEDGDESTGTASGGPSREDCEDDNGNAWMEVDMNPLAMQPAEPSDGSNDDAEHGAGAVAPELRQMTVASRELRAPAEAPHSILHGFLGTESLRKEAACGSPEAEPLTGGLRY